MDKSPDTPDVAMLKSLHLQAAIISVMLTATLWAIHSGTTPPASALTQSTSVSLQR